jgi:hypothetical protein
MQPVQVRRAHAVARTRRPVHSQCASLWRLGLLPASSRRPVRAERCPFVVLRRSRAPRHARCCRSCFRGYFYCFEFAVLAFIVFCLPFLLLFSLFFAAVFCRCFLPMFSGAVLRHCCSNLRSVLCLLRKTHPHLHRQKNRRGHTSRRPVVRIRFASVADPAWVAIALFDVHFPVASPQLRTTQWLSPAASAKSPLPPLAFARASALRTGDNVFVVTVILQWLCHLPAKLAVPAFHRRTHSSPSRLLLQ